MDKYIILSPEAKGTFNDRLNFLYLKLGNYLDTEKLENRTLQYCKVFLSDAQNQAQDLEESLLYQEYLKDTHLTVVEQPPLNGSKISLLIKTTDDKTPILFHSLRLTEEEAKGKDSYEQTRMLFDKYLQLIAGTDMTMERTCVRFNDGIDGEKYLADRNRAYEKTPFPNAFFVNGFKRDADYDKGVYTFQSVGSVAICAAVGSGETLFDACSAPGGKAVNLASSFTEVIAADIHEHRVNLIESYAKRMGKNNVTAVRLDSGVYREEYDAKFDKVLVDAPCSGTGVLKDNPDIKLNRKAEDVRSLSEIQYAVLSNCARYVRTGGNLIYSTCSVLKSENQGIIDKFLSENDGFTEEPIDSPLAHERIGRGINFFPDESFGAGFFVCRMKRVK